MIRYISTVFILITFYWGSIIGFIFSAHFRNNTEEAPFGILGVITEHVNNLRVNMIVESEIGFLLEFNQYSGD